MEENKLLELQSKIKKLIVEYVDRCLVADPSRLSGRIVQLTQEEYSSLQSQLQEKEKKIQTYSSQLWAMEELNYTRYTRQLENEARIKQLESQLQQKEEEIRDWKSAFERLELINRGNESKLSEQEARWQNHSPKPAT